MEATGPGCEENLQAVGGQGTWAPSRPPSERLQRGVPGSRKTQASPRGQARATMESQCPAPSVCLGGEPREVAGILKLLRPGQLHTDRTRKWNVNPGLFKEPGRLEARLGPGQAGTLLQAPLRTWFDLLEGRERLQLQTENYLKPLPDVVSELGFYNLLTG